MRTIKWILLALLLSTGVSCGESAPPGTTVILFLGDSLTDGHALGPSIAYPALIQEKIEKKKWDCRVINAGLTGDTTYDGMRRLGPLLEHRVDVLVLALGADDMLRGMPVDGARSNLDRIMRKTKQAHPQVKIVLCGIRVPWIWRANDAGYPEMYDELAKKNKAKYVPSLLKGVGGVGRLNANDMIHPNEEGHEMIADTVWKTLKPVLKKIQ